MTDLSALLKPEDADLELEGIQNPSYAFAWSNSNDLVIGIFPVVFDKIVKAAIHDDDSSVREVAKALLQGLSKDGKHWITEPHSIAIHMYCRARQWQAED